MRNLYEVFMKEALKEAHKAYKKGEVPIGCVIVKDGMVVARAHNLKEKNNDATAHAEILAIKKASKKLGWRLTGCEIYVTLEPCPMCAGAIIQSRLDKLVFGAMDQKSGAVGSKLYLMDFEFNHEVEVINGVCEEESKEILKKFFKELRRINRG